MTAANTVGHGNSKVIYCRVEINSKSVLKTLKTAKTDGIHVMNIIKSTFRKKRLEVNKKYYKVSKSIFQKVTKIREKASAYTAVIKM